MSFQNILNEIEKGSPDQGGQVSRRDILKGFGSKVAAAALPLGLAGLFNKASGQTKDTVADALNVLLELAYMQYNLYHKANNTGDLIAPSSTNTNNDKPGFAAIEAQELAQITYLTNMVNARSGVPFTPKNYINDAYVPTAYDFTAAGSAYASIFTNVFYSYPTFLIAAQILEDTTVHAWQGLMSEFQSDTTLLSQAVQLMSVQARHASHVRFVRRQSPVNAPETPTPWINNNIPPLSALQAYYRDEENVAQNGVDASALPGVNGTGVVPRVSATAAFDESYDAAYVKTLIAPFKL